MDNGVDLLNVIDVEATCWEGKPPPGEVGEIIEIGLVVVDLAARKRISRHRIPVRAERSAVSPFCTELTGITQAEADAGVSFAEACGILAAEHAAGERPWASWGSYDRKQFLEQCEESSVEYPFGAWHINAKVVFSAALNLRMPAGMARALRIVGFPMEGRHHRGDDDAWNIAALILHLAERGDWPKSSDDIVPDLLSRKA